MVIAYHVTLSTYGFWLPNDPRGSGSEFVRSRTLYKHGKATRVSHRRSVANVDHDARKRLAAKVSLMYPPVVLTGIQARAVGRGFAKAVHEGEYLIYACAILREHVHLVVARHERRVEHIISHLKANATRQLSKESIHPFAEYRNSTGKTPSPWAEHGWPVYLHNAAAVRRSILYVEENPIRAGLPPQKWSFVVPFDWPAIKTTGAPTRPKGRR